MSRPTPTTLILIVWLAACLVFAIFPGFDLAVTRLFYDPQAGGFGAEHFRALQVLRDAIWNMFYLVAILVLVFGVHALASRRDLQVPGRIWGFAVTLVLLAPGLIVNLILKAHWGRARPAQLDIFGGSAQFTPPLQITDQCASNCSFVSGEAAAAATASIIVGVVLWYAIPARRRAHLLAVLILFAVVAASLRVMKGRHFLSDVIWSFILSGTVAYGLARLFRLAELHARVTSTALRADSEALARDLVLLLTAPLRALRALLRRG